MPARFGARRLGGRILWSPLLLGSSLAAWWSALQSSSITLAGSNVTAWASIVGGISATQVTGANQPTYAASGLNGLPTISFNGSSSYMTANVAQSASWSVQAVASTASLASYGSIITSDNDPARMAQYLRIETGGAIGSITFNTGGSFSLAATSTTVLTNTPFVCAAIRSATVQSIAAYLNDGGQGSATPTGTAQALTQVIRLGAQTNTPSLFLNGKISDLILVNRALTTLERQKMAASRAWAFGVQSSLDASTPYRSSPPRASLAELEQWADEHGWRVIDLAAHREQARRIYTPPRLLIVPHHGWRIAA